MVLSKVQRWLPSFRIVFPSVLRFNVPNKFGDLQKQVALFQIRCAN